MGRRAFPSVYTATLHHRPQASVGGMSLVGGSQRYDVAISDSESYIFVPSNKLNCKKARSAPIVGIAMYVRICIATTCSVSVDYVVGANRCE